MRSTTKSAWSQRRLEHFPFRLADFPLLIEQEVRPANFQKPDNPAQTATIR
jgi:hypothetical protein